MIKHILLLKMVGLQFTLAAVWIQQSGRRIRLPTRATLVGSKDIAYRVGDLLRELVVKQLREWGIPKTPYQAVEEAIAETLRKATSTDSGGSAVKRCIHIQIGIARIEEFNYYGEYYDAGMARALRESALEGAKQVPAAESAIEALERLFLMEEGCSNCSVCLEDVEAGTQAIRMPCSHVYHEDCIVKWLRTSHFCPLCRYQLPVKLSRS
ncbi:hypothetical protein K2173_019692 [Erythroxylum novogranatense]|uniref:RING-type E3 ubiquitin transferase n=1 Tax=Erythroxylum novogranatense TaxID=1862640 RepID=A0AAV8SMN4_9ROSI|nr:hypothetical protein K2173_019692 [Erythroxylum novogranatense]